MRYTHLILVVCSLFGENQAFLTDLHTDLNIVHCNLYGAQSAEISSSVQIRIPFSCFRIISVR
jgi:hypothetical protein